MLQWFAQMNDLITHPALNQSQHLYRILDEKGNFSFTRYKRFRCLSLNFLSVKKMRRKLFTYAGLKQVMRNDKWYVQKRSFPQAQPYFCFDVRTLELETISSIAIQVLHPMPFRWGKAVFSAVGLPAEVIIRPLLQTLWVGRKFW